MVIILLKIFKKLFFPSVIMKEPYKLNMMI